VEGDQETEGSISAIAGFPGAWHKDPNGTMPRTTNADSIVVSLKTRAFPMLKYAWRTGALEMPETCSPDAPVEECMWTCKDDLSVTWKVIEEFSDGEDFSDFTSREKKQAIVDEVLCGTPFWPGDEYEAASPSDPTFWVVHPTNERLLQYKDIVRPFKYPKWYGNEEFSGKEHQDVCTTYEDGGYSSENDDKHTCKGHNAGDLTFWRGVYLDNDGTYTTQHKSNEETRVAVSPYTGNYQMPYIYDNFLWEHCNSTGVVFKHVS